MTNVCLVKDNKMKIISDVYHISALRLFTWNKDKYLELEHNLDVEKANIMEPIYLNKKGEIIKGWETLKYTLNSSSYTNVYYQLVE